MTHTLHRREFLVVASAAALAPAAIAESAEQSPASPTSATLIPIAPLNGSTPTHGRLTRTSRGIGSQACTLSIETIRGCTADDRWAADLEVLYPAASVSGGATHLAWSASGSHRPAAVKTLAPTDLLGRVRVRVTVRSPGEPVSRDFVFRSAEGSHLIAIPMTRGARTPAWRRCTAVLNEDRVESIQDSWRPSDATPGCTLLRVTLRAGEAHQSESHTNHTEQSNAK